MMCRLLFVLSVAALGFGIVVGLELGRRVWESMEEIAEQQRAAEEAEEIVRAAQQTRQNGAQAA